MREMKTFDIIDDLGHRHGIVKAYSPTSAINKYLETSLAGKQNQSLRLILKAVCYA